MHPRHPAADTVRPCSFKQGMRPCTVGPLPYKGMCTFRIPPPMDTTCTALQSVKKVVTPCFGLVTSRATIFALVKI